MTRVLDVLDEAEAARIAADPGLSDEARVRLHGRHDGVAHLLTDAGYAQLDVGDGSLELVTSDPGVATALVQRATEVRGDDVLVWSRDPDGPIATALREHGAVEERVLWRLHRPDRPLAAARPFPPGVTVRPFRTGQDEDAWLAVNAAAFAGHPEQGRTTRADLEAREAEDWFDPAGFLLAERGEQTDGTDRTDRTDRTELVGFHWTKVHPGPRPVGEVYVLGVAPAAQGTGLGGALLDAGLAHLRAAGLAETILYVDDDNPGAVGLYERAGFEREHRDVRYRVHHSN